MTMTTSHKRIPAAIQLVPGKDNDLINWLDAIPKGDRNQVLKDTLRAGIGLPIVATAQPDNGDTARVLSEIGALWTALDDITNRPIQTAQNDQLTALANQLNEAAAHINALYQQIEQLTATTGENGRTPPQIEGAPRVADEQLNVRAGNLKKAKW